MNEWEKVAKAFDEAGDAWERVPNAAVTAVGTGLVVGTILSSLIFIVAYLLT